MLALKNHEDLGLYYTTKKSKLVVIYNIILSIVSMQYVNK